MYSENRIKHDPNHPRTKRLEVTTPWFTHNVGYHFPMCYYFSDAVKALLAHYAPSADEDGSGGEGEPEAKKGRPLMNE